MGKKLTLKSLSEEIEEINEVINGLHYKIDESLKKLPEANISSIQKAGVSGDKQKLLKLCDYADSDSQDVLRAIIDIIA